MHSFDIEALLFDLDGTLVDSRRDLAQSVRWLQRRYQAPLSSEETVATYIGDGVAKLVQRALPKIRGSSFARAIDEFKAHYHIHCLDTTRLYAGVRETIFHFRRKKLAVITNKPEGATRRILSGLGVLNAFGCVLGGDSLRRKKPFPDPVRHALHAIGVQRPSSAVMIGDGPNDFWAGRAAGVWTCLVRSNITPEKIISDIHPDFSVHHLGALRHLFR